MPGESTDQPKLTVGSMLGMPLGATDSASDGSAVPSAPTTDEAVPSGDALTPIPLTPEEEPWTLSSGHLGPAWSGPKYTTEGIEAITYNNPFDQSLEQVWCDGKVVYALDLGAVEIDAARVKVAQEYQPVFAVELDERGKATPEPQRVPGQLNIYDSVPGVEKYSPIWQFDYVIVPPDYTPNSLRSEADCLASGYPIYRSQDFEN